MICSKCHRTKSTFRKYLKSSNFIKLILFISNNIFLILKSFFNRYEKYYMEFIGKYYISIYTKPNRYLTTKGLSKKEEWIQIENVPSKIII